MQTSWLELASRVAQKYHRTKRRHRVQAASSTGSPILGRPGAGGVEEKEPGREDVAAIDPA